MISVKLPVTYPPGNWRPLARSISFDVAGVQYRRADAEAFVRGAAECLTAGRPWGVICEREVENRHDKNAVAVEGWWTDSGWFGQSRKQRRIGYWPSELALAAAQAVPTATPLGARVTKLYLSDDGFIDIEIVALVDREWSGKLEW